MVREFLDKLQSFSIWFDVEKNTKLYQAFYHKLLKSDKIKK